MARQNISVSIKLSLLLCAWFSPSRVLSFTFGSYILKSQLHYKKNKVWTAAVVGENDLIERTGTSHENQGKNKTRKKEIIKFGGEICYHSDPLPFPTNGNTISDFFATKQHQNILLRGNGDNTVEFLSSDVVDNNLRRKWAEQSSLVGGENPGEIDEVVLVTPPGIGMVGIKIFPTSTMGTKCFEFQRPNTTMSLPEYQVVLIEDEPRAEGPRFLVWIFNKISFGLEGKKSSPENRRQQAFMRLWAEPLDDEKKVVFKAVISMWIEIKFPSFLLRFFPMKKNEAEDLCSAAIIKELERSSLTGIDNFCIAYRKWIHA